MVATGSKLCRVLTVALLVAPGVLSAALIPQSPDPGTDRPSFTVQVEAAAIVQRRGEKEFCSGALVSNRIILTALHCVQDLATGEAATPTSLRVGFGQTVSDPDTRWTEVAEVLLPAMSYIDAIEDLQGNDIALLVLAEVIELAPFPLPDQSPLPEAGVELALVGFGEDRYGYVGARHVTSITVTEATRTGFAFIGGGCLGDSGGPILDQEGRLVGLVSLGTSRHCVPGKTRFAQPLAPYADFIVDHLLRTGENN